MQTIRGALDWAGGRLTPHVASPAVDAELLLRHVLDCPRARLFSDPLAAVPAEAAARFAELVGRRAAGEPLQYLTASQSFRRLELAVGPGVLVPRPETEVVVERALGHVAGAPGPLVVDLCTGSGAVALAIATERPDAVVWATELSAEAAAWARLNAERIGAPNLTIVDGDLFGPLPPDLHGSVDLVVANPPYLSEAELAATAPDVRDHEPQLATVAGPSGLEVAGRIAGEAAGWLRPGGWLVLETHPGQAARLLALMAPRYADAAVLPDLAGTLRIAEGRAR
ncbi:MAG: peptide chain release factor N(5)-glutamine methyltransferase [Actinomycetota bacterium]